MSNITDLKRQAETILSQLTRGREFIIGNVSERLRRAAETNPRDTVIRAVAGVVESMSRKDPTRVICQAEIDQVFNGLIGLDASGTRFREVLGDLLLSEKPAGAVLDPRYAQARRDDPSQEPIDEGDPALRGELGQLFDRAADRYDPQRAADARAHVERELRSLGFLNTRVQLAGGNSRHLVFAADLETVRGPVRVHVPADASGERLPSVFVTGDRFAELTRQALEQHMEIAAVTRTRPVQVAAVLRSLDMLTGRTAAAARAAEDAAAKAAALLPEADGSGGLSGPQLVGASMPGGPAVPDVRIPQTPLPEPLKALVPDMEERLAEAGLLYPQASVRLAKRMLVAELAAMGFKGVQVRIAAPTQDGFICEALLNTPRGKVGIDVPIEMQNNQPLMPAVFAKGDLVDEFTAEALSHFLARDPDTTDPAAPSDSRLAAMSLYELKDELVKRAAAGDLSGCDGVMEAVACRFDPETYRTALLDYQRILSGLGEARQTSSSRCSRVLRSPNSIHPLCGHFMVPLGKVVQDERGTCHLASTYYARKDQDEAGAFFSNAKVLVSDD
jgi:hypothetical protein